MLLHHLSSLDENLIEEVADLGLDYIWKTMHCNAIRVQLHHYKQPDPKTGEEKFKGSEVLKSLYKKRVFRWKTLKNEPNTGSRIEVMEALNMTFKEQLNP